MCCDSTQGVIFTRTTCNQYSVPPCRQLLAEALGAEAAQQVFAAIPKEPSTPATTAAVSADRIGHEQEAPARSEETGAATLEGPMEGPAVGRDRTVEANVPTAAPAGQKPAKKPAGADALLKWEVSKGG